MQNRIYFGIVESRDDPSMLGRVKVRVAGLHTHDVNKLPTEDLPFASVMQPIGSNTSYVPVEGTQVIVMFADEPDCQMPVVMGYCNVIPQEKSLWINQLPNVPVERDAMNPVTGSEIPKTQSEVNERRTNDTAVSDNIDQSQLNQATQSINSAANSVNDSIEFIGDQTSNPNALGINYQTAAQLREYGQGNPTTSQIFVENSILSGSVRESILMNAHHIQSITGSDIASRIAKGETTLSSELSKFASNPYTAIRSLGGSVGNSIADNLAELGQTVFGDSKQASLISNTIGSVVGNVATQTINSTLANATNKVEQKLLSTGAAQVYSTVATLAKDPAINALVSELVTNGFNEQTINSISDGLTGPGGKSLNIVDKNSVQSALNTQLQQLFARGMKPVIFINKTCDRVEKYIPKVEKLIVLLGKHVFENNWDGSYLSGILNDLVKVVRSDLAYAISFMNTHNADFTKEFNKQFNKHAPKLFDAINLGSGIVNTALSLIPFGSIISQVASQLVGQYIGTDVANAIGIKPSAVMSMFNTGHYNSGVVSKVGNRQNIDAVGVGNTNSSMFSICGEGNTPPVNGVNGGPNFGGGEMPAKVGQSISSETVSAAANSGRSIVASCPPIPLTIFGCTDKNKVEENIKHIVEKTSAKLTTLESQASFLALCFAYCHCIPVIHDYEYGSVDELANRFPKTFDTEDYDFIDPYVFARSYSKMTAEEFYNLVYDTSNEGSGIGNTCVGDGFKFAEAGLLPLLGRTEYTGYQVESASALVNDLDKAIDVAMNQFLINIKGVPAGSANLFYQALKSYPDINPNVAKTAYEHFYGAKLFDSIDPTSKTAGGIVDVNTFHGSSNGDNHITGGFGDPNGVYPSNREKEKGTNGDLSRGDWVNTIVSKKEANRVRGIEIAGSNQTWDQPSSSYGAKYPYNHVTESESGHIIEVDDTPGNERIHQYHRSGTFDEINAEGSKVTRIVGDSYQIVDCNGFISISGNANVSVTGNINIRCFSDVNLDVDGSTTIKSHGSLNLAAANDININAGKNLNMWAAEGLNVQSKQNINMYSTEGDVNVTSRKEMHLFANETIYATSTGKNIQVSAQENVNISAIDGYVGIEGEQDVNITSQSGALQLYGDTNTALTGKNMVDIYSGEGMHIQSDSELTINANSGAALKAASFDIQSLGHINTSMESLSVNVVGNTNISSGLNVNITSGLKTSIKSGGIVGIDGSKTFIQSGMAGSASVTIPEQAGPAAKATIANSAQIGMKAVMYGMIKIDPRSPTYPKIKTTVVQSPAMRSNDVLYEVDHENTATAYNNQAITTGRNGYTQRTGIARSSIERATARANGTAINRSAVVVEQQAGSVRNVNRNAPLNEQTKPTVDIPSFNTLPNAPSNGTYQYKTPYIGDINHYSDNGFAANTRISKYFTLGQLHRCEACHSAFVDNPYVGLSRHQLLYCLSSMATNMLDYIYEYMTPIYGKYGTGWTFASGYRQPNSRNKNVTDHGKGCAVDIQIKPAGLRAVGKSAGVAHLNLAHALARMGFEFNQLGLEYNRTGAIGIWIHISYRDKYAVKNFRSNWSRNGSQGYNSNTTWTWNNWMRPMTEQPGPGQNRSLSGIHHPKYRTWA